MKYLQKDHIHNYFSKEKDTKMQNKIFKSQSTDLVDPGSGNKISIHHKKHKPSLKKELGLMKNTHLKLSKQFRNKQTLWKFGYDLTENKIQYK